MAVEESEALVLAVFVIVDTHEGPGRVHILLNLLHQERQVLCLYVCVCKYVYFNEWSLSGY